MEKKLNIDVMAMCCKSISAFLIFAVLDLRLNDCLTHPFKLLIFFPFITIYRWKSLLFHTAFCITPWLVTPANIFATFVPTTQVPAYQIDGVNRLIQKTVSFVDLCWKCYVFSELCNAWDSTIVVIWLSRQLRLFCMFFSILFITRVIGYSSNGAGIIR